MDTPVIDRMIKEADELSDKVEKLGAFVGSDTFKNLIEHQQTLLNAQLGAMTAYLLILTLRLEYYSGR